MQIYIERHVRARTAVLYACFVLVCVFTKICDHSKHLTHAMQAFYVWASTPAWSTPPMPYRHHPIAPSKGRRSIGMATSAAGAPLLHFPQPFWLLPTTTFWIIAIELPYEYGHLVRPACMHVCMHLFDIICTLTLHLRHNYANVILQNCFVNLPTTDVGCRAIHICYRHIPPPPLSPAHTVFTTIVAQQSDTA